MDLDKLKICVHCGLCLQACPTYHLFQNEADSPRGRIALMRGVEEGRIPLTKTVLQHLDSCLDCRACETACPAGVPYGELIESARAEFYPRVKSFFKRQAWKKFFLLKVLATPTGLQFLEILLWLYQKSRLQTFVRKSKLLKFFPSWIQKGESLLPEAVPFFKRKAVSFQTSNEKFKAAFFRGCIARILFPHVEQSVLEVLQACGASVELPEGQVCCGALLVHAGFKEEARKLAKKNIEVFSQKEFDGIVISSAGCGSALKEYAKLLPGSPEALEFSKKIFDFSQAVLSLGMTRELKPLVLRVAYQDACHLLHAQHIQHEPREILKKIPGLQLVEIPNSDRCCGSAGIYNFTHPKIAQALLEEKVQSILSTNPDVVAVGNPGCAMQIQSGLHAFGKKIPVVHPAELLMQSLLSDAVP
jgi:glycolate oxidase iron-sulfur subunit